MPESAHVAYDDLLHGVESAGVAGSVVCLHSSLRSFGQVDGGAEGVVHAFLDAGCTLLVPTFSWDAFSVTPPPESMRPRRNGTTYTGLPKKDTGRVFSPACFDIDRALGAIPAGVLNLRYGVRGNHPLNSFTAIGPRAARLVEGQSPDDVHAPLAALVAHLGYVVLAGVSLTSMTLLHVAEESAGRAPFIRWARDERGVRMVRVGGCSSGFDRLASALASHERAVTVGTSTWRVYPARETLEAAVAAIRRDPTITRCHVEGCDRCEDAIAGGPPPPLRLA